MQPQHPTTLAGVASVAEEAARSRRSEREREKGRGGLPKEERELGGEGGRREGGRESECSGLAVYIPRDYRRSG